MRPSYIAARPPTTSHRSHAAIASNQSSLNDMISKAERMLPDGKVTLKQRIGCYHWTFFTMVCMLPAVSRQCF